jgi:hypothetical protein
MDLTMKHGGFNRFNGIYIDYIATLCEVGFTAGSTGV